MSVSKHADGADRVATVRRFNRFYTRQIGVLRKTFLDSPYSLGEARVLYEIASNGAPTASEIARNLDLDPAYLSRLLRNFEKRGLIQRRTSPKDGRQSHLTLSARGRKSFMPLDARSQRDTAAMLAKLAPADQARLIAAMCTIERLLEPPLCRRTSAAAKLCFTAAPARRFRLDREAPCRALRAGISLGRTVRRRVRANRRRFRQQIRSKPRALLDRRHRWRECRHGDAGE